MSKIADERIKLTANVLNAAASGIFLTGVIAPLVAAFYGVPGPSQTSVGWIAVASAVWIFASLGLHLCARAVLGRLSE